MHLNRIISVSPQGRLFINNQEVDFDMFIIEEEAIKLLEQELMEGRQIYNTEDEDQLSEIDEFFQILDDDSFKDDDIFFEGGYFDVNSDDFDVNY